MQGCILIRLVAMVRAALFEENFGVQENRESRDPSRSRRMALIPSQRVPTCTSHTCLHYFVCQSIILELKVEGLGAPAPIQSRLVGSIHRVDLLEREVKGKDQAMSGHGDCQNVFTFS